MVWGRNSAFYQILNLFSVFFASYHFVLHTKFSVSLYSETSETNLLFRYFASLIFASVSLRFASKQNVGTPYSVCTLSLSLNGLFFSVSLLAYLSLLLSLFLFFCLNILISSSFSFCFFRICFSIFLLLTCFTFLTNYSIIPLMVIFCSLSLISSQ